jgi:hypothetical protein
MSSSERARADGGCLVRKDIGAISALARRAKGVALSAVPVILTWCISVLVFSGEFCHRLVANSAAHLYEPF